MYFFDKNLDVIILSHPYRPLNGLVPVVKRYDLISYDMKNIKNYSQRLKILQDTLALKNLTAIFLKKGDRSSSQSDLAFKVR